MSERCMTPAHDQRVTIRLIEHIPPHGPRGSAFDAAKRRMKALGLVRCAIQGCDTGAPIEYHHSYVEHAWQAGVDYDEFMAEFGDEVDAALPEEFGEHLDDHEFEAWVQSPGNLEPLCSVHHRTQLGVHVMPEPLWNAMRVWRDELPPPAEVDHA